MAIGLVLGYVLFGHSEEGSVNSKKITDMSENANHSKEHQMWARSMYPQIMQIEPKEYLSSSNLNGTIN